MARPAPSSSCSWGRRPASAISTVMACRVWSPVALRSEAGEAEPPHETPEVQDLEAALRPAWVDVDLSALEHNLVRIRERLRAGGSDAMSMAVVKADGYGHGAVGVSRA